MEHGNENENNKLQIKVEEETDNNKDNNEEEISVEEIDGEECEYDDDSLIDNEEFEKFNNQFEIQIVSGKPEDIPMDVDIKYEENENYKKEFENFTTDGEIYSIALSDKGVIVIGDGEDTTYFYDVNKKELIRKEKLNKDSVNVVCFSNDYKYLATASLDGTVNIFETEEYKLLSTVNGSSSDINWLHWHPKGSVFAFGCVDGSVWVYHAQNVDKNIPLFGHSESVSCGGFTVDGKFLITGSDDMSVKVWDLKNQGLLHTIKSKKYHKAPITAICLSKSKSIVATGSLENEVALANYDNTNILTLFSAGDKQFSIETLEFCNDDKYLMFAGTENYLKIFDLTNLQIRIKIPFDNESITKIVPSKLNNYTVYLSSSEGYFYVVDARGNCEIQQKEKLHSDVLIDYSLTKDENFAITCSLDRSINLVKIIRI